MAPVAFPTQTEDKRVLGCIGGPIPQGIHYTLHSFDTLDQCFRNKLRALNLFATWFLVGCLESGLIVNMLSHFLTEVCSHHRRRLLLYSLICILVCLPMLHSLCVSASHLLPQALQLFQVH